MTENRRETTKSTSMTILSYNLLVCSSSTINPRKTTGLSYFKVNGIVVRANKNVLGEYLPLPTMSTGLAF